MAATSRNIRICQQSERRSICDEWPAIGHAVRRGARKSVRRNARWIRKASRERCPRRRLVMVETQEISERKRKLLEQYLAAAWRESCRLANDCRRSPKAVIPLYVCPADKSGCTRSSPSTLRSTTNPSRCIARVCSMLRLWNKASQRSFVGMKRGEPRSPCNMVSRCRW